MQLFESGILLMAERSHRIGKFVCDLDDMKTMQTQNVDNNLNQEVNSQIEK